MKAGLDLEEFGFFALGQRVDGLDVFLGQVVEFLLCSVAIVLTDRAILDSVFEVGLAFAPDVADGDASFFGLVVAELDVVDVLRSARAGRSG